MQAELDVAREATGQLVLRAEHLLEDAAHLNPRCARMQAFLIVHLLRRHQRLSAANSGVAWLHHWATPCSAYQRPLWCAQLP